MWAIPLAAAVVAFVVLQTKEFVDAGRFDTPGTAADAALIAAGCGSPNPSRSAAAAADGHVPPAAAVHGRPGARADGVPAADA